MSTENTSQAKETVTETPEQKTVTFTPEQQAKIDEIIRDRQGKAASEVRAENDRLKKELADAKKTKSTEGNTTDTDPDAKELKRIADQRKLEADNARREADVAREEAKVAKAETRTVQKRIELATAAGKQDFVDVNDVLQLTERFVKFDETAGKFVVVNEDGEPRYNLAYQPMSLEELFADVATKKPHLVRSNVKPGVGSSQNQSSTTKNSKFELTDIFGPKSDAGKANKLAKDNPVEYKRLRLQAVETGLLRR